MLQHVYRNGREHPIDFYWGARDMAGLYDGAIGERREWRGFGFMPVLSHPAADDRWRGRTGLVHRAVIEDRHDLSAFDVYVAGPPAMIEAARRDFATAGLPPDRLFFDSFDYAADGGDDPTAR
jgi:CDP-4-dehydro-6-deoxyglucose reductase